MATTNEATGAVKFFIARGWTKEQASGLVGNLQAESGPSLDPAAVGDGGKAYGIAQWHPDRQANFQNEYGKPIQGSSITEQLAFVDWELNNTEHRAGKFLRKTTSAGEAAIVVDKRYERSSGEHRTRRVRNAEAIDRSLTSNENVTPAYTSSSEQVIQNGGVTEALPPTTSPSVNTALVSNNNVGLTDDNGNNSSAQPGTAGSSAGSAAGSGAGSGAASKDGMGNVFEQPWAPRPNIFKQFATMTYSVSLYLQGPDDYTTMMKKGEKKVQGLQLFVQSGGINTGTGLFGAVRSDSFPNDFYIDNIQFKSYISGASTQSMHNTFEMNFTLTEPAGLTFLENLSEMVRKRYPKARNYTSHPYLMVIRFYGYDKDGIQMLGKNLPDIAANTFTDNTSVGEKYIPFMMNKVTFRLQEDKVDYTVTAACPNSHIANDRIHGTMPSAFSPHGETLSEVLAGTKTGAGAVGGLVGALNSHQLKLANGKCEHPDIYKIEFSKSMKASTSKVVAGGNDNSLYLSTSQIAKNPEDRHIITSGGIQVNTKSKTFQISKGIKITKVIDFIVQTSDYILDQLSYKTDSSSSEDGDKPSVTAVKGKDFTWFKIQTVAMPMFDKWDNKRNDYAYEITYKVSPYKFTSEAAYTEDLKKDCFSVHKVYDYWFTGENTEVLGFNQQFDYLYYMETSRDRLSAEENALRQNNNLSQVQKMWPDTANSQTELFGTNGDTEVASNAASELYSPGDLARAEIEIVGDPDFICQSELFYSPANESDEYITVSPFMRDGSVNYNASEVYFVIKYNTIVDYDLTTGMADTGTNNVGRDLANNKAGSSEFAFVYRANIITTRLEGGKFTQKLEGTMKKINPKCKFALPLDDTAPRESSKKSTANEISASGRLNNSASQATKPKALPNLNTEIPVKPEFKTAALPDSTFAFNTNDAIAQDKGYNDERVSRDTPAPVSTVDRDAQYQANLRSHNGWPAPNQEQPVAETPYNSVRNTFGKTVEAGKEFIGNTYTSVITDPIKDLESARKKLFEKIKLDENNPFDEDN